MRRPSILFSIFVSLPVLLGYIGVLFLAWPLDRTIYRKKWGVGGFLGTKLKVSWAKTMLRVHGIHLHVKGPSDLRFADLKSKGAIFVCNHQSIVDIMVLMSLLPPNASFVAKKELEKIPIFGEGARMVGTFFIDRNAGAQNRNLDDIRALLEQGHSAIFFPEGTRSRDGKLLHFRRGAFVMALGAGVPVVPVVIFNSRYLCPKGSLKIAPGRIDLWVGDPIPTEGLPSSARFDLSEQVHRLMEKLLAEFEESLKNEKGASL